MSRAREFVAGLVWGVMCSQGLSTNGADGAANIVPLCELLKEEAESMTWEVAHMRAQLHSIEATLADAVGAAKEVGDDNGQAE